MSLTDEGLVPVEGIASRWVRLANGAKAHYATAGDTGPAIVLLHGGLPGSSGVAGWRLMMPFLASHGFRVYAPDRPGFGLSDTREEFWPREGFVSWTQFIGDFVDALCLDEFYLAGNSQGAGCTSYYVVNNPGRVKRFVLIATAVFNSTLGIDPSQLTAGISANNDKYDGTPGGMRKLLEPIIYRKEGLAQEVLEMRSRAANAQRDSFASAANFARTGPKDPAYAHWLNLKGKIDQVGVPGIYLYGRDDVLSPVDNAYLQEDQLPNIQVFYPAECGHQGQTDQPEMFNQAVLEFFRDGRVSRKTADWAGVSTRRPEIESLVEPAAAGAPAG